MWRLDELSLEEAAEWWCRYAGIQYILLLKTSARATQIAYRVYEINAPVRLRLPPPTAMGIVRYHIALKPADRVAFNMRRILSIPANLLLPDEVNANAVVDLRTVMNRVMNNI